MTTCPCCGSKFEGDLLEGCTECGARAVGPPLARPARELPAYGHALFVCATGALLLLTFAASTVAALFGQEQFSFGFWNVVAAAETAAWRLKSLVLPASLLALFAGWRVRARMRREPSRFTGFRAARVGFAMTALVIFCFAAFIGVTIPERLRQRELARRAADQSLVYSVERVLFQYRARYKTLPSTPEDLRRLPDPDGSVKLVIEMLAGGGYLPEADIAALPPAASKSRGKRGAPVRVRPIASKTVAADDAPDEGLSLTNYTLVLPGRDKIFDTEDDIHVRDGAIVSPPPASRRRANATFANENRLTVP